MSATKTISVLKSLEIDSNRVESLSEPALCELIGFIEYDDHLYPGEEERLYAPRVTRADLPELGRPTGTGVEDLRASAE
jgi:hypothetical protein